MLGRENSEKELEVNCIKLKIYLAQKLMVVIIVLVCLINFYKVCLLDAFAIYTKFVRAFGHSFINL
jgi:hypothetical protein